ncbi:MAG: hypothetical protein IJO73_01400 [Clostridia bacterium]|nr:hypothetical protein [Clostridia bacterium]
MFQGRYKSECVENEKYFFTVIRYIHQNPVKAGFCERAEEYEYSSFKEYFSDAGTMRGSESVGLCSINAVFKMIDRKSFYEFNMTENKDYCLETGYSRLHDAKAVEIIERITGFENPADLQKLSADRQKEYIVKLRESGLSIRQTCRLTGVSLGLVRRSI